MRDAMWNDTRAALSAVVMTVAICIGTSALAQNAPTPPPPSAPGSSGQTASQPASSPTVATPLNTASDPNKVDENSSNYVDGYSDGCASANLRYARQAHVKPNRDGKLYDSDNNYHEGWDHGYRKCEDRVTPSARPIMGNSTIL